MNIAVLGAAGWLGRAVLANLEGKHRVRAFDGAEDYWRAWEDVDGVWDGEKRNGDIADFGTVDAALEDMDAVIHTAVHSSRSPGAYGDDDPQPFLVNLKGLWNVLEAARRRGVRRVVHVGSCQTVHPQGRYFDGETRRPDGSPYAVSKRLQEELCRQFHEAHGLSVAVLRPDYIVDSRLGIGRGREKLGPGGSRRRNGWVCRHDLAQACRLAAEKEGIGFEALHVVGTPEAANSCNVGRTRRLLGLEFKGNLEQYR